MRFNTKTKNINKTVNYEGELAYKLTPELELYSLVCTAALQDKFYEKADSTIGRLRDLIKKVKPEFVAKLAIYAREEMYLRSIPLVLAVELAKIHKGDKLISNLVERIIQRADELTEVLGYYQLANKRTGTKKLGKLSKQLKDGIAKAFLKFDEYALGKYNRMGEVKLKDALFLTHPKPKNKEQEALFKKLVDGKLEAPYTWEVKLSEAGKEGKDKKEIWEELIDSEKIGFMAMLRNARNILNANVSLQHIIKVAKYLGNEKAVLNSKQLPFRFLSAYMELEGNSSPNTNMLLDALEDAVLISANNIKGYDYDTSVLIACDVSGSMNQHISPKSKIQNYDVGLVLGMLLQNRCKSVITGIFGDVWKVKQLPKKAILQNVKELKRINMEVGWSTNGYKVVEYLIDNKIMIDKIMVFTDCQLWDSKDDYMESGTMKKRWGEYKKINPACKMYLFDLVGYGNTPLSVNDKDVFFIAGWSDKIFDVLDSLEKGGGAIKEIEKIKI